MSETDLREILEQVKLRYENASSLWSMGERDKAEEELSDLRDVLDDVFDRPGEEVTEPTKADGPQV